MPNVAPRRLILLLLLGLSACAMPQGYPGPLALPYPGQAPGQISGPEQVGVAVGKPPPLAPGAGDLIGPHCVGEHHMAIEQAFVLARPRMAAAIELIERQPNHPHVQRWFGKAPREEIAQRLRRIAGWIERPGGISFRCNDPGICQVGSRMAYVAPASGTMGLCPAFFRAQATGYDSNWGMLVHEASHLVAGTRDHVYGPQAAMALAQQDPMRAAENADNYEYFVETLPVEV